MGRLQGWLSRVPTATPPTFFTTPPSYTNVFLQTAYSILGDPSPFPSGLGSASQAKIHLLKPPGHTQPNDQSGATCLLRSGQGPQGLPRVPSECTFISLCTTCHICPHPVPPPQLAGPVSAPSWERTQGYFSCPHGSAQPAGCQHQAQATPHLIPFPHCAPLWYK